MRGVSPGLIKGSTQVLTDSNKQTALERPKTLKKLKRVYDNFVAGGANGRQDNKSSSNSSGSDKESENKENRTENRNNGSGNNEGGADCANKAEQRVSTLSPFDEQEEWAKIQEIMASFGTGIVRESVFVSELETEFQNRLMSLSTSNHNLQSAHNHNQPNTLEKWLTTIEMSDYLPLFLGHGFDDLDFLVSHKLVFVLFCVCFATSQISQHYDVL